MLRETARAARLCGYEASTAKSVEEALSHKPEQFDLLLSDGLEGRCFELFPEIEAKRKVLLTGDGRLVRDERVKSQGVKVYLKPISVYEILEAR